MLLTLQPFLSLKVVSHSHLIVFDNYESKIKWQLIFNQVSAQDNHLLEMIYKANPGVKDFAKTGD